MKPVVLVSRTATGDAFRYTRFAPSGRQRGESTHVVQFDPAPVGEPLEFLPPADVERLRNDPERFLA